MAKRWTIEEDLTLFEYYCPSTVSSIAAHVLNRSVQAIRARAKHMQDSGAWQVLEEWEQAQYAFEQRYKTCIAQKIRPKKRRPKHLKVVK